MGLFFISINLNVMNYSELNPSNKLLSDFLDNKPFPFIIKFDIKNYNLISDFDKFKNRISDIDTYNLLSESMSDLEMEPTQTENLEIVKNGNYIAIMTGQQPGFLGGATYSLFKAITAIQIASELNKKFETNQFIPIFWIEDNDHDAEEAGVTNLIARDGEIKSVTLSFGDDKKSVASRILTEYDINQINESLNLYKDYGNFDEISNLVHTAYKKDSSWSFAFQYFINNFTGKHGLLFVSAEKARKLGYFSKITKKELVEYDDTYHLIENTNTNLINQGYTIQAKNTKPKLFYHTDDLRIKPEISNNNIVINDETIDTNHLVNTLNELPWILSPNVHLRPIVQDNIFPTAVYVGGPGELAYMAQLRDLYNYFNINMPDFALRTGATFIDKKTAKFCEKYNIQYSELLEIYPVLEKRFTSIITDENVEEVFDKSAENIKSIFTKITHIITGVDTQLEKTAGTSLDKILEQIENLRKKTNSFQKRKNEEFFTKLKSIANFLYPNGNLQERSIAPLHFAAICGIQQFEEILNQLQRLDYNGSHHFIDLF